MHGITENDQAVYAFNPAWHGLGEVQDHLLSKQDLYELAPELMENMSLVPALHPYTLEPMADSNLAITESGITIAKNLGVQHTLVQTSELIDLAEKAVGVLPGDRFLSSAFSMFERTERVLCVELADVGASFTEATGDDHKAFFTLWDSVNGSKALRGFVSTYRTVCNNTANAGWFSALARTYARHTRTVAERADRQVGLMGIATAQATEAAEVLAAMQQIDKSQSEVEQFIADMLPIADDRKRGRDKAEDERSALAGAIFHSDVVSDDLRMTAYGVFQTSTHWAEHRRDYRWRNDTPERERRMRLMLAGGAGEKFAKRALGLLAT